MKKLKLLMIILVLIAVTMACVVGPPTPTSTPTFHDPSTPSPIDSVIYSLETHTANQVVDIGE